MSNDGELPGGEFLLRLLHNPPPRHHSDPPLTSQSNGPDHLVPRGTQPNPNSTLSDSFQNLGLYHRDGDNLQFNRFADSFYNTSVKNPRENSLVLNENEANLRDSMGSSSGERNTYAPHFRNSLNYSREGSDNIRSVNNTRGEEIERLNGFEAFRNSPNLISERNSLVLNGYGPNSRDSMGSSSGESNTFAAHYQNSLNNSHEGSDSIRRVNVSNLNNGGNSRVSNGYEASYGNSSNLGRGGVGYDRPNRALNGLESNYRNSSNLGSVGEGYDRPSRVLNGSESDYRNFPNLGRIGEGYDRSNRVLNGFEADYRNSINLSIIREGHDRPNRALNGFNAGYQNSPDSSVIGEGHKASSWFNSDFPNFRNYDKEQGNISRTGIARQEIKHTPPGFSNKANNRVGGNNVESSSSGLRNWGIKFEDERGKGEPPTGSALDSVSGFGIEESLSESHNEIGEKAQDFVVGDASLGDSNDFVKNLDTLDEEDGSSEKNQKRHDKDYRSDTRGQRVLAQWMRRNKRMIQCRNDINMFNAPLLAIFDSLVPPEEEKIKQKQLLAFLEKLVVKEWPEARLLVYGSCANSFGVKKSDIDICLAMKDQNVNKSKILSKLADILIEENLENVQALTHARVPIVKLMDPVTQISCDICCNNVLAVVNSKLLRDYAKIDGRLRQLAFIVKHWAKLRGVNETYHGTLSSYAYVLMCIHFLQQCRPAILPCLQGMDTTYKAVVENVECAFFDQVEKLDGFGLRNRENIGQLLWGFFRYWAYCHDYTHDVVSVRVGSIISKQAKDWTRRIGNDRHLICIEDPFDITHDLGRVVDKFSIKVLREEFERAAQILQYDPNPCVTLFEPYVRS